MKPTHSTTKTLIAPIFLLTALSLHAQEEAAPVATDSSTSLLGLLQQGGWAMFPLGLTALFMFFLIFYCWRETVASRFTPANLLTALPEPLRQRDVEKARSLCASKNSVLSRCLNAALAKAKPQRSDANREKIEGSFMDNIEAEDGAIGQWINYLNVVAAVAPMIGLLGTVSGMISAFQTIGQVGMGDPSALASDIGEALVTTATGLVIGIPAMIAYFIFRNRLNANILKTVESGGDLIDELVEGGEVEEG
jgi:biopolymer transport protein ExbB